MADPEIKSKADASLKNVLDGGQSVTQGDQQVSKASAKDSYNISKEEENRCAVKSGRRPLLRNININGMS